MFKKSPQMPSNETALPGRTQALHVADKHYVLSDKPLRGPYPESTQSILFGMGCFWGAERRMWQQSGVYTTAAGYSAGFTPNPSYEEVCSGLTGHNEVVLVVYEGGDTILHSLLKTFWESHDPTQEMRQGNDIGTQYRSGIYVSGDEQKLIAERSKQNYQRVLTQAGYGAISTEIVSDCVFYFAEDYHQQYLAKNPNGYCGLGGTGVCAID